MNNTVISVKVDKNVKKSAQEVAKSAGLNLSTIINSYLRQIIATRHIDIYSPEQMSPNLEKLISKLETDLKKGNISSKYSNIDDFIADLKN
jgi:DNA-damage-inducible protein J